MIRRHRLAALALAALATASLPACGGGGSPAPTCRDGARNGAETGVDCGGPACTPCPAGQGCAGPRDCLSDVCSGGATCAAPSCADGVRNGRETGVDCGGACTPCADGLACQVDGDCTSGRCQGQVCLKALGSACGGGGECASGACADGLCCESACGGTCEACNLPGRFGHCDPVPAGADPAGECAADDPSTCLQDGACSGERSCRLHPAGTVCTPAACTSATAQQPAATCDGLGACAAPAPLACSPLTCDPAAAACRVRCADATECDAGYGCAPGGTCLELDGQACAADGDCLHGFCTDGVCCGSRCDGTCEACDQPGRVGTCDAVPAGDDPAGECAATDPASCGTSGACSGTRSCALWAGGTPCGAASCASDTASNQARACDGAGLCSTSTFQDCAPLRCDAASGTCKPSCVGSGDCAPGYGCVAGACRKVQGSACAADGECQSGFCTDGVCCEARCGGTCEKCNQAGRPGFCDAVTAGSDPDQECAEQGAASCGTSGVCSGARACALYSSGTTCAAASCAGSTAAAPADTCDGAGTCVDAGTVSCTPFTCNAGTGACRTSCAVNADCAGGYGCAAGACKRLQGTACAADGECQSGFCTDGACCEARCGGTCEKCNQAGRPGFCDPIPAGTNPDAECPVDACHPGLCSGSRSCGVAAAGTPCGAGLACDAAGSCLDVNECASGTACDPNATCTNTTGSFSCACNAGWLGDGATCRRPVSCLDLLQARPASPSGIYRVDPDGTGGMAEFDVYCDMVTTGGGWTVFQRRQDATDFYRTYAEYQAGFGSVLGSFWLGLDRIAALTTTARTLRVEVLAATAPVGPFYELYDTFRVGGPPDYVLTASGPSGTAGDSLGINSGHGFSTKDRTATGENATCVTSFQSAWWHQACTWVNLNGPFAPGATGFGLDRMFWMTVHGNYDPLAFAEMKLR